VILNAGEGTAPVAKLTPAQNNPILLIILVYRLRPRNVPWYVKIEGMLEQGGHPTCAGKKSLW
jgi:hypothetical protein